MDSLSRERKPHAVCIPFPAQGHINPMMKLAKILNSRNFHITFVHTEFNRNRLLRSYGPKALDGLPSFRFEAIPDGLPPNDADATQDIPSLCRSIDLHCLVPFRDLLRRLNRSGHGGGGVPPVSCIVSDVSMCFTLDAAEELGIPEVMLWTSSSCGCLGMAQYDQLIQLGLVPFKGTLLSYSSTQYDRSHFGLYFIFNICSKDDGSILMRIASHSKTHQNTLKKKEC